MNPYQNPIQRISHGLHDWQQLLPEPLDLTSQPQRRARLILAAAALEDAPPMPQTIDARRQTALIRRVERQQRLRFLSLLPHAHTGERLLFALFTLTELTAAAAQAEALPPAKAVMDFLLPEACDMLYRTANLLSLEYDASAQQLLCGQAELMPGRPCIAAHRHPYDDVQPPLKDLMGSARTYVSLYLLHALSRSISRMAADALQVESARARALYAELSLILSEHATQYGGLLALPLPPTLALALRAYAGSSVYHDLLAQEELPALQAAYQEARDACCAHLRKARALHAAAGGGPLPFEKEELPPPLLLQAHKGYIRGALRQVGVTLRRGERLPVGALPDGADFFRYQQRVNADVPTVPSHAVVAAHIRKTGQDFRFELAPHPVEMLRDRAVDQVSVGR